MRRVRLAVVVPGIALGLLLILGGALRYLRLHTPQAQFLAEWDGYAAKTAPVAWPLLQQDPDTYRLLKEATAAAFQRGGWPEAHDVFWKLLSARYEANAGDDEVVGCFSAWLPVLKKLQSQPHYCRVLQNNGLAALPQSMIDEFNPIKSPACDAMMRDGARRRLDPRPPRRMSPDAYAQAWQRAVQGPVPLTQQERDALLDPGNTDDAAFCSAVVHQRENVMSLPKAEIAGYIRASYGMADTTQQQDAETAQSDDTATAAPEPLFLGHPPAEFHCAAPGTRFILSMEQSSDGRPITWTMQSQEGWDCRIHSSASGDRGLWSNRDDRNNPIRLLWPLQLGKSVPCPCGNGGHLLYRVSSHQEVWLPIGRVDAYGIDEVALNDAGEPIYTITHYWAPSLGFIIGQRAVEQKGSEPDETAPDWQVVAIEPPDSAAETGLRIELPSGTN